MSRGIASCHPNLVLGEVEITRESLLQLADEQRLGRLIRDALARLQRMAPYDPRIARCLLLRLEQAASGRLFVARWGRDRARQRADCERIRELLALRLEAQDDAEDIALRTLLSRVLRRYPFEPERLIEWTHGVVEGSRASNDDKGSTVASRVHGVLGRLLERVSRNRDALALANTRLVLREVLRYRQPGIARSDLFQEGFLGVQRAALRYDPERRLRFSSYAVFWVKQAIRQSVRNKSRVIRVPERAQSQLQDHRAGRESPYDDAEAARVAGVMYSTSFFSAVDGADDEPPRPSLAVTEERPPRLVSETELTDGITGELDKLDRRERSVLKRRFGLEGGNQETLESIGRKLKLSRERVRQIEKRALARLRKSRRLRGIFDDWADED